MLIPEVLLNQSEGVIALLSAGTPIVHVAVTWVALSTTTVSAGMPLYVAWAV